MTADKRFSCPGCGLIGGDGQAAQDTSCAASNYCFNLYQELTVYTLSLGDADFIHQHVIDTYTAQHSSPNLKGIQIYFALIGLYLYLDRGYSGREVQQTHKRLAEKTKDWPQLLHQEVVSGFTVYDVLSRKDSAERSAAVHDWASTVWQSWNSEHQRIIDVYSKSF